jgi:hypothetical protein
MVPHRAGMYLHTANWPLESIPVGHTRWEDTILSLVADSCSEKERKWSSFIKTNKSILKSKTNSYTSNQNIYTSTHTCAIHMYKFK